VLLWCRGLYLFVGRGGLGVRGSCLVSVFIFFLFFRRGGWVVLRGVFFVYIFRGFR